MQNRIVICAGALIWISLALFSFLPLLSYESKAALSGGTVQNWPLHTHVNRDGKTTVLMFLHPLCPCSSASLNQLDRLMAASGASLTVIVFFEQPGSVEDAWSHSSLQEQAASIPGVKVVLDKNQTEAKNFCAATSGETFLYTTGGKLLFHGGLTPGRGHEGDCDGYDRALSLIRGKSSVTTQENAIFGCALFNLK